MCTCRCAQVETEISTAGVNHGACVTPEYFKLKTLCVFFFPEDRDFVRLFG